MVKIKLKTRKDGSHRILKVLVHRVLNLARNPEVDLSLVHDLILVPHPDLDQARLEVDQGLGKAVRDHDRDLTVDPGKVVRDRVQLLQKVVRDLDLDQQVARAKDPDLGPDRQAVRVKDLDLDRDRQADRVKDLDLDREVVRPKDLGQGQTVVRARVPKLGRVVLDPSRNPFLDRIVEADHHLGRDLDQNPDPDRRAVLAVEVLVDLLGK